MNLGLTDMNTNRFLPFTRAAFFILKSSTSYFITNTPGCLKLIRKIHLLYDSCLEGGEKNGSFQVHRWECARFFAATSRSGAATVRLLGNHRWQQETSVLGEEIVRVSSGHTQITFWAENMTVSVWQMKSGPFWAKRGNWWMRCWAAEFPQSHFLTAENSWSIGE